MLSVCIPQGNKYPNCNILLKSLVLALNTLIPHGIISDHFFMAHLKTPFLKAGSLTGIFEQIKRQ